MLVSLRNIPQTMATLEVKDRGGDGFRLVELENGYRVPLFHQTPVTILDIWKKMPHFECREDDIMLCSFPKTGTNWLYEIIGMILQQKAERLKTTKMSTNLEAIPPEPIASLPSPRILNTHIHYRFLPGDMKKKQVKTILVLRNPKDTAVSFYNHMRALKLYGYSGKWENWLPPYMNGEFEYGTYESYLLEFEKAMKDPGFPLHVLYYEDLKEDGTEEIKKLAKFLGFDFDDDMCRNIQRMCGFDLMKKEKFPQEIMKKALNENMSFFRKGEVGDWKHWFTVSQNEMFDAVWNERMKDSKLKFKYVPSKAST